MASEHTATQAPAARRGPEDEVTLYLGLYRQMAIIREFEDVVQRLFVQGHVHGTTHLYSGQEAGAVGVCSVLRPEDRVAGTYRGHGHSIARGLSPQRLLDEMLGRSSGVCGGRAGSMNVIDLEHGFIGSFGIVGGSIGAATGAALALKRTGGVAVAFFGEGATNQAYFHECLNFAQVSRLPAVFMCENNLYGEFTPMGEVTAGSIRARAEALGIRAETIDGNDVWTVRQAAQRAVDHARSGAGPAFVESLTYRFVGHSRNDPGKYRAEGEMDRWRARDPLTIARVKLAEHYGVDEQELNTIIREVEQELERVQHAALAAPYPAIDALAREFKEA